MAFELAVGGVMMLLLLDAYLLVFLLVHFSTLSRIEFLMFLPHILVPIGAFAISGFAGARQVFGLSFFWIAWFGIMVTAYVIAILNPAFDCRPAAI